MEAQIQFRCVSVANDNMDPDRPSPPGRRPSRATVLRHPAVEARAALGCEHGRRRRLLLAFNNWARRRFTCALPLWAGRIECCRQPRHGQPSQPRTGVLFSNAKIAPTVKPGPIGAMTHLPDRRICQ